MVLINGPDHPYFNIFVTIFSNEFVSGICSKTLKFSENML